MNDPRPVTSNANFCWFCSGALVGPGGVPHKEPLFYRVVKTHDGHDVRVHAACEKASINFMKVFTAKPPEQPGDQED